MELRQKPAGGVRLNRVTLAVGVTVVVLLTVGVVVFVATVTVSLPQLSTPAQDRAQMPEPAGLRPPDAITQRPRDYGHIAAKAPPSASGPPPAGDAQPRTAGVPPGDVMALLDLFSTHAPKPPAGLAPPPQGSALSHPDSPATPGHGTPQLPGQGQPTRQGGGPGRGPSRTPRAPGQQSAKPASWFSGQGMQQPQVLKSPFGEEDEEDAPPGVSPRQGRQRGQGQLLVQAQWERPKDVTKVLYAQQPLQGLLYRDINSDTPGPILILVTEQVEDILSQGHVLIPQYTYLIGKEEGKPAYAQTRVPGTITLANFPDGTAVSFRKATVGDQTGAGGIPSHVNNHWFKLGVGVLISAAVNIGARAPFGSTEGFQPSLGQEYASAVGSGAQQPLQQAIRQQFIVPPTLTQQRGFPVTIMLEENVSFQTDPKLITR